MSLLFFLNKGFKPQSYVCYRCNDLVMMSMNLRDINVLNNKGADYCCIIGGISKKGALILTQNIGLAEKSRLLENIKIHYHI